MDDVEPCEQRAQPGAGDLDPYPAPPAGDGLFGGFDGTMRRSEDYELWTRAALLGRITAPTLVIHGQADPLVPLACGEDTARRIPGAQLLTIDGMGHDLPPEPVRQILAALIPHLKATA